MKSVITDIDPVLTQKLVEEYVEIYLEIAKDWLPVPPPPAPIRYYVYGEGAIKSLNKSLAISFDNLPQLINSKVVDERISAQLRLKYNI